MQRQLSMPTSVAQGGYWLVLYALIWLVLSGGKGWGFGAPLVLIASILSLLLGLRPLLLNIRYLPNFVLLFLRELLQGGWDVARRAFLPRLPLNPAWVEYPLTLPSPRSRMALAVLVCLLPGTLASRIEGDHLHIHVLDADLPWRANVMHLEQSLGKVLGDNRP